MENIEYYMKELNMNLYTFELLFASAIDEQIYWKPTPEKWSLLEVACHLLDEEREDFKPRLKSVLETPETPFTPIDPVAWVTERKYSEQQYNITLQAFARERKKSLDWLDTLENAHWENSYLHPKVGPITGKMLLANWVAHDYLHIRQIVKLKYDFLAQHSSVDISYAGTWL